MITFVIIDSGNIPKMPSATGLVPNKLQPCWLICLVGKAHLVGVQSHPCTVGKAQLVGVHSRPCTVSNKHSAGWHCQRDAPRKAAIFIIFQALRPLLV